MKHFFYVSYKTLLFLCKLLLIGDILLTAWSVCGRYLPFVKSPVWSEDLILTQMVYLGMLSASLAIRKGSHIRMTAFDRSFSRMGLLLTNLISDILVLALGVLLTVTGIALLRSPLCSIGRYASLPLSKFWQYLPAAAAGASMILFELEQIGLDIKALHADGGKGENQ